MLRVKKIGGERWEGWKIQICMLIQFSNICILTSCYQLVTSEAIRFWNLIQLLLGNMILGAPIYWPVTCDKVISGLNKLVTNLLQ